MADYTAYSSSAPKEGCKDTNAINYCNSCTTHVQSMCRYPSKVVGCMDPLAINYNKSAESPCKDCCIYETRLDARELPERYGKPATPTATPRTPRTPTTPVWDDPIEPWNPPIGPTGTFPGVRPGTFPWDEPPIWAEPPYPGWPNNPWDDRPPSRTRHWRDNIKNNNDCVSNVYEWTNPKLDLENIYLRVLRSAEWYGDGSEVTRFEVNKFFDDNQLKTSLLSLMNGNSGDCYTCTKPSANFIINTTNNLPLVIPMYIGNPYQNVDYITDNTVLNPEISELQETCASIGGEIWSYDGRTQLKRPEWDYREEFDFRRKTYEIQQEKSKLDEVTRQISDLQEKIGSVENEITLTDEKIQSKREPVDFTDANRFTNIKSELESQRKYLNRDLERLQSLEQQQTFQLNTLEESGKYGRPSFVENLWGVDKRKAWVGCICKTTDDGGTGTTDGGGGTDGGTGTTDGGGGTDGGTGTTDGGGGTDGGTGTTDGGTGTTDGTTNTGVSKCEDGVVYYSLDGYRTTYYSNIENIKVNSYRISENNVSCVNSLEGYTNKIIKNNTSSDGASPYVPTMANGVETSWFSVSFFTSLGLNPFDARYIIQNWGKTTTSGGYTTVGTYNNGLPITYLPMNTYRQIAEELIREAFILSGGVLGTTIPNQEALNRGELGLPFIVSKSCCDAVGGNFVNGIELVTDDLGNVTGQKNSEFGSCKCKNEQLGCPTFDTVDRVTKDNTEYDFVIYVFNDVDLTRECCDEIRRERPNLGIEWLEDNYGYLSCGVATKKETEPENPVDEGDNPGGGTNEGCDPSLPDITKPVSITLNENPTIVEGCDEVTISAYVFIKEPEDICEGGKPIDLELSQFSTLNISTDTNPNINQVNFAEQLYNSQQNLTNKEDEKSNSWASSSYSEARSDGRCACCFDVTVPITGRLVLKYMNGETIDSPADIQYVDEISFADPTPSINSTVGFKFNKWMKLTTVVNTDNIKRFYLAVEITSGLYSCCDYDIYVDDIVVGCDREIIEEVSIEEPCPGFDLKKIVDNKRSWVYNPGKPGYTDNIFDEIVRQGGDKALLEGFGDINRQFALPSPDSDIPYRQTDYYNFHGVLEKHSKLILNSKEVNLFFTMCGLDSCGFPISLLQLELFKKTFQSFWIQFMEQFIPATTIFIAGEVWCNSPDNICTEKSPCSYEFDGTYGNGLSQAPIVTSIPSPSLSSPKISNTPTPVVTPVRNNVGGTTGSLSSSSSSYDTTVDSPNVNIPGITIQGLDTELATYSYSNSRTNGGLGGLPVFNGGTGPSTGGGTSGGGSTTCPLTLSISSYTDNTDAGLGTATVSTSNAVGSLSYLWSNGQTTATVTGLTAGGYTVKVTDGGFDDCSKTISVLIRECNLSLTLSEIDETSFPGSDGQASVSVSGNYGNLTYSWSTSGTPITQTGSTITGLTNGIYTVVVTDDGLIGGNCTATGSTTVHLSEYIPSGLTRVDGYDAVVWLESDVEVFSDAGTTLAVVNVDDVYQWNDQTRYDNHAIQTDAGDRPSYVTGHTCFNGKDLISFNDNQGDYMGITNDSSFDTLTEMTMFVYFKSNDIFSSPDIIVQHSDDAINGGQTDGWTMDYQSNLGTDYLRFVYDDASASPNGYNELEIVYDYSVCNLVTVRVSGNTIDMWTGTTKVGTNTVGNGMDTPAGGFPLTIAGNYTGTQISPLDFGTYILYEGPLSDSGISSVQDYILSKYGECTTPTDGGTTSIGDEFSGADSFLAPINGLEDYSWSATIYEASEIGSARQITGLEYYVSIGSDTTTFQNQTVILAHVAEDSHTSSPTIGLSELTITDAVTAYTGNYVVDGALWKGITFDENFCYNGSDNLIVIIYNNDGFGSAFQNVEFVFDTEVKYYTAYASNSGSFPTTVDARTFARPVIRFSH